MVLAVRELGRGVGAGVVVRTPYAGPSPPHGVHRYVFLVAAQPRDVAERVPFSAQPKRAAFDVCSFLIKHRLVVVGVTLFTVAA